jgi:HD-GYP domain-containing protein (c-di-GMP phosphodiesterase class II)
MFEYELPIAVATLDKKELLPAGTFLTEPVVADVAALGRLQQREECSLLEYGTVQADLQRFLAIPPYSSIFSDKEVVAELFAEMKNVRLPLPLLKALDYFRQHDFHTYRHILMVFNLSSLLVKGLGENRQKSDAEFIAGPSHDFGKISVPLHVLKKAGPLTIREKQILKYHPVSGYVLLAYYLGDHRHPAVLVARDHHERRDGSGYPRGISTIDPVVEMVAACDVYDALLSPRPYRPLSYDNRTALEEMTRMADSGALGWECVEALVSCNRHGRPGVADVSVSRDVRGTPPVGNCYGLIVEEDEKVIPDQGLNSVRSSS